LPGEAVRLRLVVSVGQLAAGSRQTADAVGARDAGEAMTLDIGTHVRDVLLAGATNDESLAGEWLLHWISFGS
jgi:hypothetical protein